MSKQLFIIGNKRSGTSLLIQLLNAHPDIFVSHESDIIWLLYQSRNGMPKQFECYEYDSCTGMEATLAECSYLIAHRLTDEKVSSHKERLHNTFVGVTTKLMSIGSLVQPAYLSKTVPTWLGDKKPTQQCDPRVRPFIYDLFPEARFIHIVRHPYAVVSSKILYRKHNEKEHVPEFWHEDPFIILEYWAKHERWVLDTKQEVGDNVLTVRLEDLATSTEKELLSIADFLDVDPVPFTKEKVLAIAQKGPNVKYMQFVYPTPDVAMDFMELYGYGIS